MFAAPKMPTQTMVKYLAFLLCLAGVSTHAESWRPSERLLHAIRFVESSHGAFTWGDNGQSLGDFQLSEAAWVDVTSWRKARGLATYGYDRHVWDRKVSRTYAADYLVILRGELKRKLSRSPTPAELYAAYNMGIASFAQCQFRLAKVNPVTARKCQQINLMVEAD
jgi:hypothetical protein